MQGPYRVEPAETDAGTGEGFFVYDGRGTYYPDGFYTHATGQLCADAMNWAYTHGWMQRDTDQRDNGLRTNLLDNAMEACNLQMGLCYEGPRIIERLAAHYGSLRKLAKASGYSACYLSRIRRTDLTMPPKCYLRLCDLEADPEAPARLTAKVKEMVAAHAADCGVAINGRHDCSCGANMALTTAEEGER